MRVVTRDDLECVCESLQNEIRNLSSNIVSVTHEFDEVTPYQVRIILWVYCVTVDATTTLESKVYALLDQRMKSYEFIAGVWTNITAWLRVVGEEGDVIEAAWRLAGARGIDNVNDANKDGT